MSPWCSLWRQKHLSIDCVEILVNVNYWVDNSYNKAQWTTIFVFDRQCYPCISLVVSTRFLPNWWHTKLFHNKPNINTCKCDFYCPAAQRHVNMFTRNSKINVLSHQRHTRHSIEFCHAWTWHTSLMSAMINSKEGHRIYNAWEDITHHTFSACLMMVCSDSCPANELNWD